MSGMLINGNWIEEVTPESLSKLESSSELARQIALIDDVRIGTATSQQIDEHDREYGFLDRPMTRIE